MSTPIKRYKATFVLPIDVLCNEPDGSDVAPEKIIQALYARANYLKANPELVMGSVGTRDVIDAAENDQIEVKTYQTLTLYRHRPSEDEIYSDDLAIDVSLAGDCEIVEDYVDYVHKIINEYLATTDNGRQSYERSSEDYNWGDFSLDIGDTFFEERGVIEMHVAMQKVNDGTAVFAQPSMTITVNQDERLFTSDIDEIDALSVASQSSSNDMTP